MKKTLMMWVVLLAVWVCWIVPFDVLASENIQAWEVINPSGIVAIKMVDPAPRLTTLDGKTIVLRWNGKHNGDNYLNRFAELMKEKVPSAKIIKLYELDQSTVRTSGSKEESERITKIIRSLKPDIVVAAQAD
jgi:hypothetical protein